jgi:hypothetical protein
MSKNPIFPNWQMPRRQPFADRRGIAVLRAWRMRVAGLCRVPYTQTEFVFVQPRAWRPGAANLATRQSINTLVSRVEPQDNKPTPPCSVAFADSAHSKAVVQSTASEPKLPRRVYLSARRGKLFMTTNNYMNRIVRLVVLALVALSVTARADDRRHCSPAREKNKNYILRRQEAYQVQGVPTSRLIIGKREIDIYPNGMMFEGDHLVGIKSR